VGLPDRFPVLLSEGKAFDKLRLNGSWVARGFCSGP
jgi:hypothetical protein